MCIASPYTRVQVRLLEAVRVPGPFHGAHFPVLTSSPPLAGFFYDVAAAEGDVWAMMPWADFFNYSPAGDDIQTELRGTTFCFRSSARWRRGEQVAPPGVANGNG